MNNITITISGNTGVGKSAIVQVVSIALQELGFSHNIIGYDKQLDEKSLDDLEKVLVSMSENTEIDIREVCTKTHEMDLGKDKLVSFLYLLMRDEVPTGVIPQILAQIPESEVEYSNKYLREMASDYASRILEV